MRAVIDTNVVISRFLSKTGPPALLYDSLLQRRFEFVASPEIFAEYLVVLSRPAFVKLHGLDSERIAEAIELLREVALLVVPSIRLRVVEADPKDDKFIECAVAGGADVIVSGDKHLLALGSYEGIRIVSPAAFVMLLELESPAE